MPPKAKSAPAKTSKTAKSAVAETTAQAAPASAAAGNRNVEEAIRVRAYELAAARGFQPGSELEDWLRAEAEVLGSSRASA